MTTDRSWTTEAQTALDLTKAVPTRTTGAVDEVPAGDAYAALKDAARVAWACGNEDARHTLDDAATLVNSGSVERAVQVVEQLLGVDSEPRDGHEAARVVYEAADSAEDPQEAVEAAEAAAEEHGLGFTVETDGRFGAAGEGGSTTLRFTGAYADEPGVRVENDGRGWSVDLDDTPQQQTDAETPTPDVQYVVVATWTEPSEGTAVYGPYPSLDAANAAVPRVTPDLLNEGELPDDVGFYVRPLEAR